MTSMPIFVHRFFSFTPSKPRHPLLRILIALLGLVVLALVVVFGVFIGAGMLLFAAARKMLRSQPASVAPQSLPGVIDGEYSVVDKTGANLGLR